MGAEFTVEVFKTFGFTAGLVILCIIFLGGAVVMLYRQGEKRDKEYEQKVETQNENHSKSVKELNEKYSNQIDGLMEKHTDMLNTIIDEHREEKKILFDAVQDLAKSFNFLSKDVSDIKNAVFKSQG